MPNVMVALRNIGGALCPWQHPLEHGIGNICILTAIYSNPLHNQSFTQSQLIATNFSSKIGCHGNDHAGLTYVTDRQTNRQTDRPCYSVSNNRPHLPMCSTAMRSNNNNNNVYGAVLMTMVTAEVYPVHLTNAARLLGSRQPSDQPTWAVSANKWLQPSTSTITIC